LAFVLSSFFLEGKFSVRLVNGETLTFQSCSLLSTNGTDVHRGQIPFLLYSLEALDRAKKRQNPAPRRDQETIFSLVQNNPLLIMLRALVQQINTRVLSAEQVMKNDGVSVVSRASSNSLPISNTGILSVDEQSLCSAIIWHTFEYLFKKLLIIINVLSMY
jgi:hypothetical protein